MVIRREYLFFIVLLNLVTKVDAGIFLSVSQVGWQDKIQISQLNQTTEAKVTYSVLGLEALYSYKINKRHSAGLGISRYQGDYYIQNNAVAQTIKNQTSVYQFSSQWGYRLTNSTSTALNLGIYQQQNKSLLGPETSYVRTNIFLDLKYEIFESVFLIQSIGTAGIAKDFSYKLSLSRKFF